MRLIDADWVLNALTVYGQSYDYVSIGRINEVIKDAPTIEAEPVRRGRWILEDDPDTGYRTIVCSACGEDVISTAPCFGGVVAWDYCPWCGARMEEQE